MLSLAMKQELTGKDRGNQELFQLAVYLQVYSGSRRRWLHCDPCENVCDCPLLYEIGWGKKLSYVMAYSRDEVQDVTWRYSCRHQKVLSRRTKCTESELLATIMRLRQERQQDMSDARKLYVNKRLVAELVEFLTPRQPTEAEKKVSVPTISRVWPSKVRCNSK